MRFAVVAEDNGEMAAALRILLTSRGWTVVVAGSGSTAISAIQSTRPLVALIDVGLPGLSGLEVARRARAEGVMCRLIAMSGFASVQDRKDARAAGFDLFLAKPVDPAALYAAFEGPAANAFA
jgi:DNA-binding response OmpR family regulator